MWVKLKDGSLEFITGFSVEGATLKGRVGNASKIVLHIYETEEGAQAALEGITQLTQVTPFPTMVIEELERRVENEADRNEADEQ